VLPHSSELGEFRAAVIAQGMEAAGSELADYAATLLAGLRGLEPEECGLLLSLFVHIHSLGLCGIGPLPSEMHGLMAATSRAIGGARSRDARQRVGWIREGLRGRNPHGSDWWLPRLLCQ
jgi:hypothetical protein